MVKARVFKSDRREYDCKVLDGSENIGAMVKATALGNLLKDGEVVVGDFVVLEEQQNGIVIKEVLERKNEVFRRIVRERKKKVTASNLDFMVILCSVSRPSFKRGLVDRYLLRAFQWNIMPLVVFNKMDEHNPKKVDLEFENDRLKNFDVETFEISAKDEDLSPQYGGKSFFDLKERLSHKTSLFLGQSGVGKSKTITALTNGEIELLSKEVAKVGKGAHTTTWSEMIESENLSLIDSPGVRSYSLEDLDPEDLMHYFPDLYPYSTECQFKDCDHEENSKGCRFFGDFKNERERMLIHSRLESYKKISAEILETPHWAKK